MGLQKIMSEIEETKKTEKIKIIEEYKQLNKESAKITDLMKRLEILEKLMGLE